MSKLEPHVGIFYLIDGHLVFETAAVSTIPPSGNSRAYPRQHFDLWEDLKINRPELAGMDCYSPPRGRISFKEDIQRFDMVADRHIIKDKRLVAEILEKMNLDRSLADVNSDPHYQCNLCSDDGFE